LTKISRRFQHFVDNN